MCLFVTFFYGKVNTIFQIKAITTKSHTSFTTSSTLSLIHTSRSPNRFLYLMSHQEGMVPMWKKNIVADVPLLKNSTKNNLITYYLRFNSIVTDAVYQALTWPGPLVFNKFW